METFVIWLFGIGLAVLLLFHWLTGHWFARILVFLVLIPPLILCAAVISLPSSFAVWLYVAASFVIAWLISGLPTYYHREQDKQYSLTVR